MKNSFEHKAGLRLAVNNLFGSNDSEVELRSSGVGEHRGYAGSKRVEHIKTIGTKYPALHNTCFSVGAFVQLLHQFRLTGQCTSKSEMVFYELIDLRSSPFDLFGWSAMETNALAKLVSAIGKKIVCQIRWQRICGAPIVGVPGRETSIVPL